MDHLNGVFIVDRVSEVEKIKYKNQLKILELDSKKHIEESLDQKKFVL